MPLSRRMLLAAREWLWRIQIATSRIRSQRLCLDRRPLLPLSAHRSASCV
jgi:hypothetical protein